MWYHYDLNKNLDINLVEEQEKKLLSEWYVYNSEEISYDLFKEKFEEKKYFDFIFYREREIDSQLSQYEVYENLEITDVKYKTLKKEKWFIWWIKNIYNIFISKKETNISDDRLKKIQLMVSKKKIKDLKIIKRFSTEWVIKELTELEIKDIQEREIKYSFLGKLDKPPKKEIVKIPIRKEWIEEKDFRDNYEWKFKIKIDKEYTKKVLKEKIIIDRREIIEQTQYMYVPWVWSMMYNHEEWTEADFKCEISIRTISGFSVYDEEFFNHEKIKEDVIDIIKDEHWMTKYIREREDEKDWFNIEDSTLV